MSPLLKRLLLHILLPLVIGFFIYFFYRPQVVFIQWIAERKPLLPLDELQEWQRWLIYSGPDFCWCYSLSSALFTWHQFQFKRIRFFPVLVILLLLLQELLQARLLPQFTFDWADIVAAVLAFGLSYWFTSPTHAT
jgi:hypothetical protein